MSYIILELPLDYGLRRTRNYLSFQVVAGTNWIFRMSVKVICEDSVDANGNPSTYTTSTCNDIKAYIPLPCRGDEVTNCIKKGLKITGFKTCSQKDMKDIKMETTDSC